MLKQLRAAIDAQDYVSAGSIESRLRAAAQTCHNTTELAHIQQELTVLREHLEQQQTQRIVQLTGLDQKARRSAAYLENGEQ